MVLDDLKATIEALFESGPGAFADGDSVKTLLACQSELGCLVAEAVAAFDTTREWQLTGARSATAWLKAEARLSEPEARSQVRRGRALSDLPRTRRAWEEGAITGSHVDIMASLHKTATEEALERDEEHLVDQARTLSHGQFVRATRYWQLLADPDGSDEDAEARATRRDAYLVRSFSGTWLGRLTLDPVSGSIVGNELCRLEHQLFEAEWAEATERLGREPGPADLMRTPGQRRADAFVLMATRSATMPEHGRRPRPLFTALVGYETMHGRLSELEDGTVVPPGSLLPWLLGADIERAEYRADGTIQMGTRSRMKRPGAAGFEHAVLAASARVECPPTDRFFTGATRRAVEVRDRWCAHPGCDLQASRCQIDHIRPYAQGGPTTQANGRVLCGPHNRARVHRDDLIPLPKRE